MTVELEISGDPKILQNISYRTSYFEDEDLKNDVKYRFDQWIEKYRPNKLLCFWSNNAFIAPYILFFTLFIFLQIITNNAEVDAYKSELNRNAYDLIEEGINKSNIYEALEINLKLETNYVPKDFKYKRDLSSVYKVISFSVIVLLILLFPPRLNIAIGKGSLKVIIWKRYLKFIFYSLPVLIILPLLISIISNFISG